MKMYVIYNFLANLLLKNKTKALKAEFITS